MEMFLFIALLSILGYGLCVCFLILLSLESYISKTIVYTRVFVQYLCSLLLITAITACILHFQAEGWRIIGTRSNSVFISDLVVLVFLFSVIVAFNIRFIRIFCQPVYLADSIPNLDQFFLYLRPFETDKTTFERFIRNISWESYGAIAIANPNKVIQNVESDKVYASDEEWKDAVHNCMRKSKFNILHVGNTDGCLWELEQCLDNQIKKTIFVVSTEEGYSVLRSFLEEIDKYTYFPKLPQNGSIAFYLRNPNSLLSWENARISNRKDAERIIKDFISVREELKKEIETREKAIKKPISSLFKDNSFPKSIGMFSWAWISVIGFPFLGRLRPIYFLILLLTTFVAICSSSKIGPWGIYGIAAFIALYGKRMMWLSYQWVGGVAMDKQINFFALISVISFLIAFLLAKWYLLLYPI